MGDRTPPQRVQIVCTGVPIASADMQKLLVRDLFKKMYCLNLTAWKYRKGNSNNQSQSLALKVLQWLAVGVVVLLMLLIMVGPVQAQSPTKPLRVATRIVPPFVFEDKGKLVGFSIDLWRSITDEMGVKSELFVNPTVADLLSAVKSDKADLGIAAISMTAERDKDFDFSYSIFESRLQILVRENGTYQELYEKWFTSK